MTWGKGSQVWCTGTGVLYPSWVYSRVTHNIHSFELTKYDCNSKASGGVTIAVVMPLVMPVPLTISVSKSGLVWSFCLFWHNWTETGLWDPKKLGNCNHNCMQPVVCSCMVGCNQLQLVAHQTGPGPHSTSCNWWLLAQPCRYVFNFCSIYWLLIVLYLCAAMAFIELIKTLQFLSLTLSLSPQSRLIVLCVVSFVC